METNHHPNGTIEQTSGNSTSLPVPWEVSFSVDEKPRERNLMRPAWSLARAAVDGMRAAMVATALPVTLFLINSLLVTRSSADDPVLPPADNTFREQTVYIPFDDLRETFERQGRGVFIPYERFQELWEAARKAQFPVVQPPEAPVKAIVNRAEHQAKIHDQTIQVHSELQIEFLSTGWIRVPLRLKDASIVSAQLDGQPARLVSDDQGWGLLVERSATDPARRILVLEYARRIAVAPGKNSAEFQPPISSINRWSVEIDQPQIDLQLQPMVAATEIPTDPSVTPTDHPHTRLLAYVGATPTVTITWTPKQEGAHGLDAFVRVRHEQISRISRNGMTTRLRLDYDVQRSEFDRLTFTIPEDFKVVTVQDANVRQWTVAPTGNRQLIDVQLFQPARTRQTLEVELEYFRNTAEVAQSYKIPDVIANDVNQQSGIVLVELSDDLRVIHQERQAMSQLDRDEVPEPLRQGQWDFAYRFAAIPYQLTLSVEAIQPHISVDTNIRAILTEDTLKLDAWTHFDIQRAGLFELQLQVPDEWNVQTVEGVQSGDHLPVAVDGFQLLPASKGWQILRINLATQARNKVAVRVRLQRLWGSDILRTSTGKVAMATISIPHVASSWAARSHGIVAIFASEGLRVRVVSANGARNVPLPTGFPAAEPTDANIHQNVATLEFGHSNPSVEISAERRQPEISAIQQIVGRLETGKVLWESRHKIDVRYSSVNHLRIDVPTELADRINNASPELRESLMTPPPGDLQEGYVAWQLAADSALLGKTELILRWEVPHDPLTVGQPRSFPVPRLLLRGTDRLRGQLLLAKEEALHLQTPEETIGLIPVDPQHDALPEMPTIGDASLAYDFYGDWNLDVAVTRYEIHKVETTTLERGLIRAVATRSGRHSIQALYRVRSNQQRIALAWPEEISIDDVEFDRDPVRVNGIPVPLEHAGDNRSFFVPLVGNTTGHPFILELRYTTPSRSGRIISPQFPQDPSVHLVQMVPYLPQEWVYLGSRGDWSEELVWRTPLLRRLPFPETDADTLLGRLADGTGADLAKLKDFSVDGQPLLFSTLRPSSDQHSQLAITAVPRRWFDGLVFAALLVPGVLLSRIRWSTRLSLALAMLIGIFLIGSLFPPLGQALLNYTTFAAIALVIFAWIGLALLGFGRRLTTRRNSRIPTARAGIVHPRKEPTTPTVTDTSPPPSSVATDDPVNEDDSGAPPDTSDGGPHNA